MGGGPAGFQAFGQMADKAKAGEKGAKANSGMMDKMKDIDPFTKMTQNLDKMVQAAIPLGGAVDEALSEVTDIFNGAFMEGFAPAMDVIINTLTRPEVLTAITEIGTAFADIFIAMAPLVVDLLPAFIWIIKAVANVMILFINIIITIANFFIEMGNWFTGKAYGTGWIPYYDYVLAGGGDFLTNGPTSILAGEAGQERVTVTPVGEGSSSGGVTVNVYAGTVITDRELAETIRKTVDDVMRDNTLLK